MAVDEKRNLFVKHYLTNGQNATQAAISAGYAKKSAHVEGSKLLRNPKVKAAVARGLAEMEADLVKKAALLGITAERILSELGRIAFANIEDFANVTDRGLRIKPDVERRPGMGRVVKKLTESTSMNGGSMGIELHSKDKALESLCRILGLNKDTLKLVGDPNAVPVQVVLTLPSNGREAPPEDPQPQTPADVEKPEEPKT